MALSSASASGLPAVSSRRFGVKGGKSSKNSGVPIGKFSDKGEVPPMAVTQRRRVERSKSVLLSKREIRS